MKRLAAWPVSGEVNSPAGPPLAFGSLRGLRPCLLAPLLLTACGGGGPDSEKSCNGGGSPSSLEGSYCEGLEMRFTRVDIELFETSDRRILMIEYVRPLGDAVEKTLQITFDTTGLDIEPNTPIGLLDVNASVRRILSEGNLSLTRDMESSSTITFESFVPMFGAEARGRFAILFVNGRTLSGKFEGTVRDASEGI